MAEFMFVFKTALFSVLLLVLLQMKVGSATIEQHSESWIYGSRVGHELNSVAHGAVRAGHEAFSWVKSQTSEERSAPSRSRNRERTNDLD